MSFNQSSMNATLSPDDSIDIVDLFNQKYNKKYRVKTNFFEGVNSKVATDTNDKMEMFYEYMTLHNILQQKGQDYIDIYDKNSDVTCKDGNVYQLVVGEESSVMYKSLSYLSLLQFALQDLKSGKNSFLDGKIWNIVAI